ncbi:MAG: hypothetical protein IT428_18720 [Planctomycetaceae bacterium]|nr:hypothetical protein [Planctomycetaceae bacterium]
MNRFFKSSDIMIFGGLLLVAIAFRGPAIAAQIRTALFTDEPAAVVAATSAPAPQTPAAAAATSNAATAEPVPSFDEVDGPQNSFSRPARTFRVGHRCGH